MAGFTLDGVHSDDLGVIHLEGSEAPMLPDVRNTTVQIPGRHGVYDFGARMDTRGFSIPCMIPRYSTLYEVQEKTREIARLLTDMYGNPRTVKLIYDYEPDKYYNVRVADGVGIDRIVKAGEFELPLVAHDPWAYSSVSAEDILWGSVDITFESTYLLGTSGTGGGVTINYPQTIDLFINGYSLKPIIEITGTASGGVTFSANGRSFSLPAFTNASWTVDGERFTVLRNGANGLQHFSGDFIELMPGPNTLAITGSGLNFDLTVRYRDKYM